MEELCLQVANPSTVAPVLPVELQSSSLYRGCSWFFFWQNLGQTSGMQIRRPEKRYRVLISSLTHARAPRYRTTTQGFTLGRHMLQVQHYLLPGNLHNGRMMSGYIRRGPNATSSLCIVPDAKQDLSYFCMWAPF